MFCAGSTPKTFLKPSLIKGFKKVPSFDAISIIKSFSLFKLIFFFILEKKVSE